MLFCLPRHPGNVLDVMELSDLKRKERVAAAHYLEEHSLQQKQQKRGLIAILHCFAVSAMVVMSLAYKGWQCKNGNVGDKIGYLNNSQFFC